MLVAARPDSQVTSVNTLREVGSGFVNKKILVVKSQTFQRLSNAVTARNLFVESNLMTVTNN